MLNASRLCLFYFVCTFIISLLHLLTKELEPLAMTFAKQIVQIYKRDEEFYSSRVHHEDTSFDD